MKDTARTRLPSRRSLQVSLVALLMTAGPLLGAPANEGITPAANDVRGASGGLTRESLDAPSPSKPAARRAHRSGASARSRKHSRYHRRTTHGTRHHRRTRHRRHARHARLDRSQPAARPQARRGFVHGFRQWWQKHFGRRATAR